MAPIRYRRHHFPPDIIPHAIRRYPLPRRGGFAAALDAELCSPNARRLRRHRPRLGDRCHPDEMVIRIAGKRRYEVDPECEVLDMLAHAGATAGPRCG
jgi:transposase-like protein